MSFQPTAAAIIQATPALAARIRFDIVTEEMTDDQIALVQNLGDRLLALITEFKRDLELDADTVFHVLADAAEGSFEGVTSRALVAWKKVQS